MLFDNSRAGVPVFNLPSFKPKPYSVFESPKQGASPILPPGVVFLPQCITPFKNVPVVRTVDLEKNLKLSSQTTPSTIPFFFIIKSSTEASRTSSPLI